jgi:hypothetical protein
MTARLGRTVCSVAALALATACTSYYEIPIETPIRAKLDVGAFQRVLVAGFISGGTDDVDGNLETTRLLRSQLRTKSQLRVIDTDVLPLVEVASDGRPAEGGEASAGPNVQGAPAAPPAPAPIREKKDIEAYEHVFANTEYWKKIGEEYQQPLIVTGTVLFTPQQNNTTVQTEREVYDSFGRRRVEPVRVFRERKGFALSGRFVFIDGRTGATLHSQSFGEQVLYAANQTTPALSSYFELMDRLIPSFLSTLSSQKIKGTRILLQ